MSNLKYNIPDQIWLQLPEVFKRDSIICSRAPGRINLIGEHTDYNQGLVLPGAINRYAYFFFKPRSDAQINIHALDLSEKVNLKYDSLEKDVKDWANFFIGILLQFQLREIPMMGFDCAFSSEVPIGAGMSSSAALECGFLVGLQDVLNTNFKPWELIKISQQSNHNFLGIKGGILDQFTSIFGRSNTLMALDCDTLDFKYYPWKSEQLSWFIINSCVKHSHLSSGYNDRTRECALALKEIKAVFPEVRHLSDGLDQKALSEVSFSSTTIEDRANYIVQENERVEGIISAIQEKDFPRCGQLLYQSHEGLSKKYEVSCPELDYLVETLKGQPGVLGSRMMGGGFGGCTINLVENSSIQDIMSYLTPKYKQKFGIEAQYYQLDISDGAQSYTKQI